MNAEAVQTARNSLSRCTKDPAFLDRFYELFMASSEDIRKKFEQTDFEKQKKVLSDSLFLMLTAAGTSTGFAHVQLEKLAKRHSRSELGIKPEWYALWLDSLMTTVSEFDPDYAEDVDAAWRSSLKDSIDFLISRY